MHDLPGNPIEFHGRIIRSLLLPIFLCVVVVNVSISGAAQVEKPASRIDYQAQIAPILNKYCVSCHNSDSRDGELSMETYEDLLEGGAHGAAILVGDATNSRLVRVITGDAEPKMPPDDMEAPSEEEIAALVQWLDSGAVGPSGTRPDPKRLIVPELTAADGPDAITAMAWSPDGKIVAMARFRSVDMLRADNDASIARFGDLPGKVNRLIFSDDGKILVAATGVTGLVGVAIGWDVTDGSEVFRIEGHRDSLYAVAINFDNSRLATAGYDKSIQVWDLNSTTSIRTLRGHNQPVFDLDFHPTLPVVVSASADETLKVWNIETGDRLDTLSQPLAEQYVARFTPDGSRIIGAGVDNRIRVWRFKSREEPTINPLLNATFAHEGPIAHVDFSADGTRMVSVAEDLTVKVWETINWRELLLLPDQPAYVSAVAISPDGASIQVGRLDGSLESYRLLDLDEINRSKKSIAIVTNNSLDASTRSVDESEPNDDVAAAQSLEIPSRVSGVINQQSDRSSTSDQQPNHDVDLYRIEAVAGSSWVLEINAKRAGSSLDSMLEVLNNHGEPIERVRLQAVRDSYFTFRGKDSNTSDDFRVHNWEEMELNEYLYANGEVVKLWLYPRGPDSGFKVYPGRGSRHAYFGTTPLAHALQNPCYIVEAHAPGTELVPNGLPMFPIYWENDDDSLRELGSDSRLIFVAPYDGEYLVRVTDARGFSGPDHTYQLTIRPARPSFQVGAGKINAEIAPGSGREFTVNAKRIDGFNGEITVEVEDLPEGFNASSPIRIEAGQYQAKGMIWAEEDAQVPVNASGEITLRAWADIEGKRVTKKVNSVGALKLSRNPSLRVRLLKHEDVVGQSLTSAEPIDMQKAPEPSPAANIEDSDEKAKDGDQQPLLLAIRPGETIAARVRVERNGHKGLVSFGKEDSGRNLPHGVYVDNIGLNGLMIVEGRNERTFFITCADWVQPQERMFHLRAEQQGGQCSIPAVIRVLPTELVDTKENASNPFE